jgi:hypothetical protein
VGLSDDGGIEDAVGVKFASDEVQVAFDFLTDAAFSDKANMWHNLLSVAVFLYMIMLCGVSMDGPLHYEGRANMATEVWLPNENGYIITVVILSIPLIIDSVARAVVLCMMSQYEQNFPLWHILMDNTFEKWTLILELCASIPLLINLCYFLPMRATFNFRNLPEWTRLLFRMAEMLNFIRFIRTTKDSIAMRASRTVLYNSGSHLLVSLWFFLAFITMSAVIFFYLEPCYDEGTCAWKDMFETSWFSVVTITTVGYGDMVPYYEHVRLLAIFLMFFGVIFTAMPLAIIGNEYEMAWDRLNIEAMNKKKEKMRLNVGKAIHKLDKDVVSKMQKHAKDMQDHAVNKKINNVSGNKDEKFSIESSEKKQALNDAYAQRAKEEVVITDMNTTLLTAMKGLRSTMAMLKINLAALRQEKRKPNGEKYTLLKVNYVSPQVLQTAIQLREWILLLRISLAEAVERSEAECIDPDIPSELENTTFLSCREAFELLSGETGLKTHAEKQKEIEKKREKAAKRAARRARKTEMAARKAEKLAGKGNAKAMMTADDQFQDMKEKAERNRANLLRSKSMSGKSDRGLVLPNISDAIIEGVEGFAEYIWASLLSGGTNRVSPGVDTKQAKLLNAHEYVDNAGNVHHHHHHHHSFTQRFLAVRERQVEDDPHSLQNQMYDFLLRPMRTQTGRYFNTFLMIMVFLSITLLFSESLTTYQSYGEATSHCERAVELYCEDKLSTTDPACYVQNTDYSGIASPETKLSFNCDTTACFGYGANFGASNSLMSCKYRSDSVYWLDDDFAGSNTEQRNFAEKYDLLQRYGMPSMFSSRLDMQTSSDVCGRVECRLNGDAQFEAKTLWVTGEFVLNNFFACELIMRAFAVGNTFVYFMSSPYHFFDLLAIVPFYVTVFAQNSKGSILETDFSLLPTSYDGILFNYLRGVRLIRLFRVMEHFQASKTLLDTGVAGAPQIMTVMGILLCIVLVFSLFFYEIEAGESCYISDVEGSGLNGNKYCGVDEDAVTIIVQGKRLGDRIVIDKLGDPSEFRDVFQCMWFCFVTITTVGYGDIFPVTNNGKLLTIFMMIMGGLYMAIPLTAIGAIFYDAHIKNSQEAKKAKEKQALNRKLARVMAQDEIQRVHEVSHIKSGQYMGTLYKLQHKQLSALISDLRKDMIDETDIDFDAWSHVTAGGTAENDHCSTPSTPRSLWGAVRAAKKKFATKKASRALDSFMGMSEEGYGLVSRTVGVLVDMVAFTIEKEKQSEDYRT